MSIKILKDGIEAKSPEHMSFFGGNISSVKLFDVESYSFLTKRDGGMMRKTTHTTDSAGFLQRRSHGKTDLLEGIWLFYVLTGAETLGFFHALRF